MEFTERVLTLVSIRTDNLDPLNMKKPTIVIEYCTRCHWLARASWMAQELLTTFEEELGQIALKPNKEGGVYNIFLDGHILFSRKKESRFPEITELKILVRDQVAPEKNLGHTDASRS